jgi:hypothetical protein
VSATDRVMIATTIIVSMALGLAFVIGLERPWRVPAELRMMAWLQVVLVATPIAFDLLLLMVVLRVPPPLWLIIAVLFAQDSAYAWRLFVLIRAHHERNRS